MFPIQNHIHNLTNRWHWILRTHGCVFSVPFSESEMTTFSCLSNRLQTSSEHPFSIRCAFFCLHLKSRLFQYPRSCSLLTAYQLRTYHSLCKCIQRSLAIIREDRSSYSVTVINIQSLVLGGQLSDENFSRTNAGCRHESRQWPVIIQVWSDSDLWSDSDQWSDSAVSRIFKMFLLLLLLLLVASLASSFISLMTILQGNEGYACNDKSDTNLCEPETKTKCFNIKINLAYSIKS